MIEVLLSTLLHVAPTTENPSDADPTSQAPEEQSHTDAAATFTDETQVTATCRADIDTPASFKDLSSDEIDQRNFGQEPSSFLSKNAPSVTSSSDSRESGRTA